MLNSPDAYICQARGASPAHAVELLFDRMGLDRANPLGSILEPGQTVLVKPNLVHHRHYRGGRLEWVVTCPKLVEAVCDYVFLAIGPKGTLILGDAPLQSADWSSLISLTGLDALPDRYLRQGYRLTLADFRTISSTDWKGVKCNSAALDGDPNGYRAVDLAQHSLHAGRDWERMRVTNYHPATMRAHHNEGRHEYLISGSALSASAIVSLPKLKTHRKSGLTCALKNLVGINGCKDWLPHHTAGAASNGGDEYNREAGWKRVSSWIVDREETVESLAGKLSLNAARKLVYKFGQTVDDDSSWEGSWHGNDTLWRTILDLNRAVLYANAEGILQQSPQRKLFTIVDAMIAGEGEGPMAPDPVNLDCLIGAENPVAAEVAAAQLADWPANRLRHISGAFGLDTYPLANFTSEEVRVHCFPEPLAAIRRRLKPTSGYSKLFEREAVGA